MKHIQKVSSPQKFKDWKRNFRINERRSATFKDLQENTEVRLALKQSLLQEQFFICCYCGVQIDFNTSHIEHFKPRNEFREEQLNYQNMLASCLATRQSDEELSCGHNKGRYYDPVLLVSPLEDDCEILFKYTMNGMIRPAANEGTPEWSRANKTIEVLNLNTYRLTELRMQAINGVLFDDPEEQILLSETELRFQLVQLQHPNEQGRLESFCVALQYMINKELDTINIKQKAVESLESSG